MKETLKSMNHEILEKLKLKRKEIAEREGKKLFMVFHNAVLERTTEVLPQTKEDLANIKGWGKRKIEKYGDEVLSVINGKIATSEEKEKITDKEKIFSVYEFITFINSQFSSLGMIRVRGEITEIKSHPNGYCFVTIKDSKTKEHSISCYLDKWKFDSFNYLLEVGMEVVVSASPLLYKNGGFSLTVSTIEPFGEGALKKAFEALKKKLRGKGYFDESRKRPLPAFIRTIGLMTSETGDAIYDFRKHLGEYGFKIYFLDVRVEGDYAEGSISSAIKWFNKNKPEIDVLVLTRGGGSLENLKVFNSESVAEAIFLSRLPIITGIGHEKDETIADYVADKSFSTPTATAVFIKIQRENLIIQVKERSNGLMSAMDNIFNVERRCIIEKVNDLKSAFVYIVEHYRSMLSKIVEQMQNGLNRIFRKFKDLEQNFVRFIYQHEIAIKNQLHILNLIVEKCLNLLEKRIDLCCEKLNTREVVLSSLNPESILKRGYSVVYKNNNEVLRESKNTKRGEQIITKLYKGKITSVVEGVER